MALPRQLRANSLFPRLGRRLPAVALLWAGLHLPVHAQAPSPDHLLAQPARSWIDQAAANQERIVHDNAVAALMYRTRKVDARGSATREVIESREGTVARLLERDGQKLTPEENQAEIARLNEILTSPDHFLGRREHDRAARGYADELIRAMPGAMLWSYAAQQPQPNGASGLQVVIDFVPDPTYRPPSLVTEALTGIAGRVWIDAGSHCVTRIEGHILHPVNFGWGGILARINAGGTVAFEQTEVGPQRFLYSRLAEHLTIREVFVHTVREDQEIATDEVKVLPAPIPYRDAIATLLALPVPTR